jgi:hypothetical protein
MKFDSEIKIYGTIYLKTNEYEMRFEAGIGKLRCCNVQYCHDEYRENNSLL